MKFIQRKINNNKKQNTNNCLPCFIQRAQTSLTTVFLVFLYLASINTAQAIEPQQLPIVTKVIEAFKQNDRVAISKMVSYPLLREAPLKPIDNPRDFLKRYNEVFDRNLLTIITQSNPEKDWNSIGWQGVILGNEIISLDPEGNITEINYQSQRELALANQFNSRSKSKGRRALHRSVTNYQQAVVEITTKRFHIRVDDVGNGRLRYASWPINKKTTDQPDLILTNGRVLDNNGRNPRFVFDNGTYSYQLNINSLGYNSKPTASLEVFKGGNTWVREEAIKVILR